MCGFVFGAVASGAMAVVPTPQVTGPIPFDAPGSADHNYPFLATDMNLAARGYVEEEFFYSGTANRYNAQSPNATGPAPTADIVNSGNPYKTRMMVRRPIDPAKFNGVVVVEWTNVTSLMDTPQVWFRNHEQLMRAGYAYVGIAPQNLHIAAVPNGLRNWSPLRYGTLDIADDDLSYDVFAQGVQAVRSVPIVLGGLQVRRVIATGVSQSATRLAVYVNAIFPRDPAIVDGVQPIIGGQKIRTDLSIPVMKVLSEVEFPGSQTTNRQPDTDRFRTWWVTGTSHSENHMRVTSYAVYLRDLVNPSLADDCTLPTRSRIPFHYVEAAAIDAMVKWIDQGVPPATSPLPQYTSLTPRVVVARDAYGNALGGIRLAPFAVPTATSTGANTGSGNCILYGVHIPFDTATLASLYPTHDGYVQAFTAVAEQNFLDGFVLKEDELEMIRDAQSSIVGTGLVCGPLCVDFKQFMSNPSPTNLRDIDEAYYFPGGETPLVRLDKVTTLLAQGYTAAAQSDLATKSAKFQTAIQALEFYISDVEQLPAQGRADPLIVNLLADWAGILIDAIAADAGMP
jgi:hypothetical protein